MRKVAWMIIGFYIISVSCNQKKNEKTFLQSPSFKEIISKDSVDFLEYFDSSTNIYSNFYHGFGVRVPSGWHFDRGFAENSVFQITNYDSGIVFIVNVNKFLPDQIPDNLVESFRKDSLKFISGFKRAVQDNLNLKILDLEVKPVYYLNQESLKSSYNYLFRSDEIENFMYSEGFQFIFKERVYSVALIIPKEFYDKNNYYKLINNNFNLIPIKHE